VKQTLIACASVAFAIAASGCSSSDSHGGSARLSVPFASESTNGTGTEVTGAGEPAQTSEPTGTTPGEPTTGGPDPTPGGGRTIAGICERFCAHFESFCPGAFGGTECASDCAASTTELAGCLTEYLDALNCLADAPIMCAGEDLSIEGCQAELDAFDNCQRKIIGQPGT